MTTRHERRIAARYRWDRLTVSFWFAPALMALGAILLAWAMYWLDGRISSEALADSRFVLAGTVDELRSGLLSMATTVLTTAGIVFTLLTLPLSTVAAQYGSRLLRLFLRDRTTRFVLGMFVATFVYCIAAALSISHAGFGPESPQLTATVGLYLMLATFASLILLVQHISTMLQAPNIAAAAGVELVEVVNAEVPEQITSAVSSRVSRGGQTESGLPAAGDYVMRATKTGYIQFVDPQTIVTLAAEKDLTFQLLRGPGQFVCPDVVVARVWPAERVDSQIEQLLQQAFRIGNGRRPTQDVEYAVDQLAEMAVRAMSPAINDPFTAMTCVDHLSHGLEQFIQTGEKDACYYDQAGRLRLVMRPVTFEQLLGAAFDMLRHASCDNASVLLHMLEAIERIGREAKTPDARQQLLRQVSLIQAESRAGNLIEQDRQRIQRSCEALQSQSAGWQ